MESPCKKCEKYDIPKCMDDCKKLHKFQIMILYKDDDKTRIGYDPLEDLRILTQ